MNCDPYLLHRIGHRIQMFNMGLIDRDWKPRLLEPGIFERGGIIVVQEAAWRACEFDTKELERMIEELQR